MTYGGRLEAFCALPSGESLSATSAAGGTDAVSLTAGAYTITSLCAHIQARLNAVNTNAWTVSVSTGPSGTGLVTITRSSTPFALTMSADLRDLLGFAANISSTSSPATGTKNARGLWLPKCPLEISGHPTRAPTITDARSTRGPTGKSLTLIGASKYRHRGLRWTHVLNAQMFRGDETTTNASLQQWLDDTQFGAGHSWFTPGSPFQVYWSNNGTDALVGADLNTGSGPITGWTAEPAISSFEPQMRVAGLLRYWTWELPAIESEG